MNHYYKNNSGYLLELKPPKLFSIIIITFILLIIFLIFSFKYKISNYIDSNILVSCEQNNCHYYLYSTLENVSQIMNSGNIYINKKHYPYIIENLSEIKYDDINKINYQLLEINLKLEKKYNKNNMYLNAKIMTKEEKLIDKISKIIFEKE